MIFKSASFLSWPDYVRGKMDKPSLIRRALRLEYVLIAYNVLEAIVAIGAGVLARSIALTGFGLDSVIEVTSAAVLVWRLKKHEPDEETRAEKTVLRIVGVTFFLLAVYVSYESIQTLRLKEASSQSLIGIGLAILSSIVMPALGLRKRKVALELGSKALAADAVETLVCAYLSVTLLLGLGLNALFGWWWADPVAGLIMVGFILKEGWEAIEESREEKTN